MVRLLTISVGSLWIIRVAGVSIVKIRLRGTFLPLHMHVSPYRNKCLIHILFHFFDRQQLAEVGFTACRLLWASWIARLLHLGFLAWWLSCSRSADPTEWNGDWDGCENEERS